MITVSQMKLDSNILSLGAILGTSGSADLIANINQRCGGGSFFGSDVDPFKTGFTNFMQTVVQPVQVIDQKLKTTAKKLFDPDQWRAIDSLKELEKGIPPCMHLPILYYEPIRKMHDEERIDGFGINARTLQEEDPYKDLIESGRFEIHSSMCDKNGDIGVHWRFSTVDPELTPEQIVQLDTTRQFIDRFLNDEQTKVMDFTDYPNLHC